jgi:predicted RNA binding protein YcfA (HicA-like mRNA interferase family)
MRGRELLRLLMRPPLSYRIIRQRGSHRRLASDRGYPPISYAYHDADTVGPAAIRRVLIRQIGLEPSVCEAVLRGEALDDQ